MPTMPRACWLLLLVTCACGGSKAGPTDAGSDAGASGDGPGMPVVPVNHRPDDSQCAQPRQAQGCGFTGGTCSTDADCTSDAGTNGRCVEPSINVCTCSYDTCATDGDCPTGQTCACHGSTYLGDFGSTCVPGNCRVDADCGANGYCSPSAATTCGNTVLAGYYCHTAMDRCTNDPECPMLQNPNDPNDLQAQTCGYSTAMGFWQCQPVPLCSGG